MPKAHGTPDRDTRRRIGSVLRRVAKYALDPARGLFDQGLCTIVAQAWRTSAITCMESEMLEGTIALALQAQPYDEPAKGSAYIPGAMLGRSIGTIPVKQQAAIRASWLRHWEETGVALDYYEWQDRAMKRAEKAGERRAAALAKKKPIAPPKGGRFILAA